MTVTSDVVSRPTSRAVVRDYVLLTKPRIIELLLVTTIPVMFAAAGGWVSLGLLLSTVAGGTLAAASANVFNCVLDRDIDAAMRRTAHRGTATGVIGVSQAIAFGTALGVGSIALLGLFVNWLSAALACAAIVAYVGGYTVLLKRRTSANIVWGGLAGCFPVLIGWAAVTGRVSMASLALFLVVFFWTPPHYWPLSMKFADDYNAAGVPMLGAVASAPTVANAVIRYAWATVGTSLVYAPLAGAGIVYWSSASMAGGWFIFEAYRLRARIEDASSPMRLFHFSITYLTLVFLAVGVDAFVR